MQVNEVVSRIQQCLRNVLHLEEYWLIDPQRIIMALSDKYQLLSCSLPECETLTDEQLLYAFSQCLYEDQIGARFPVSIDTGSRCLQFQIRTVLSIRPNWNSEQQTNSACRRFVQQPTLGCRRFHYSIDLLFSLQRNSLSICPKRALNSTSNSLLSTRGTVFHGCLRPYKRAST